MQHKIPVEILGPQGTAMANAIEACVHCGFCLPACPTYKVLAEEMDSPRGRIFLMKDTLEGQLSMKDTMPYIDRCLGCVGCVPACPSGVAYGELLSSFRAYAEAKRHRSPLDRLTRFLMRETLPHPQRFRLAAATGKLSRPFRGLLPGKLGAMLDLLPAELPPARPLPEMYPARSPRRARAALLTGCVQQVLAPEINWATLRVLARNGVEVVIPRRQGCCGALAIHTGDADKARALARNNLSVFPSDVDAILSNAAGCGSGIRDYGLLFKGEPDEAQATEFAQCVKDISVFLEKLGVQPPIANRQPLRMAYHDACHLAHAQGVREAPRRLLQQISNLSLTAIGDEEICCGSAGTYNVEQPEIARELGERKARNVLATGAEGVVTGNIGCITQIRTHLAALGQPLPVYHTMEVLDQAYSPGDDA